MHCLPANFHEHVKKNSPLYQLLWAPVPLWAVNEGLQWSPVEGSPGTRSRKIYVLLNSMRIGMSFQTTSVVILSIGMRPMEKNWGLIVMPQLIPLCSMSLQHNSTFSGVNPPSTLNWESPQARVETILIHLNILCLLGRHRSNLCSVAVRGELRCLTDCSSTADHTVSV